MSDGMYEVFSRRDAEEPKEVKINKYVYLIHYKDLGISLIENRKMKAIISLKDKTILKIAKKLKNRL